MVGGAEFELFEQNVLEENLSTELQSARRRRSRRCRRHGGRKASGTPLAHPPGVFVLDSENEDEYPFSGRLLATEPPPRNVVTWNDLVGELASKKAEVPATPCTNVVAAQPAVSTAVAVWPADATRQSVPRNAMAQWPCSWSQGPGMHCLFVLPTPVEQPQQQDQQQQQQQHPAIQIPQQLPMQATEWADNPHNADYLYCSSAEQATGLAQPSTSGWDDHRDAMRQLLLNNTGGRMPSAEELVQQLQAVAPDSYED